NRFFLDPVLGRGYSPDLLADLAPLDALEPAIRDGDLELIGQPLDWIGVNYYAPTRVVPLADPAAASNRERVRVRGRGGRRRPGARPRPHPLPRRAPAGGARRDRAGCGCARLPGVVVAGQLRVVVRLHAAVRAGTRGLRDPAADREGQRPVFHAGR